MTRDLVHAAWLVLALGVAPYLGSCSATSSDEGAPTASADTLTRRQKDSIVSTLPVPGARAVGRALDASDQAATRAIAHDTIR